MNMQAPLPKNEDLRLEALCEYHILDTLPEEAFDRITLLASHICKTPIALVSLVDKERQWFKSRVGLEATETPRDLAFCAHAILDTELFIVPDTLKDTRFANNALVVKDPKIRFYAGSPLLTPEGLALGTLCVIDRQPRELDDPQKKALKALSQMVMTELELRRKLTELKISEEGRKNLSNQLKNLLQDSSNFFGLLGKSSVMKELAHQIQNVAEVEATVLIEGETGSGKELVAKAVHDSSKRKDKPFLAVNCAAFAESLLTSQLFGHKRGAFTGALQDAVGIFEAAEGGTIFLDEIGDMPIALQTSLLRVLQEKEITRLGETKTRRINVRVIAATHRDLSQEVSKGHFREDLLYRIRVARLRVPPLRERREDISLLAASFLQQQSVASGKAPLEISLASLQLLLEHPWPGNVRELKSAMEYAGIHADGKTIEPKDLPPEVSILHSLQSADSQQDFGEKERILKALKEANGNRKTAALLLGISRATLFRRLANFQIP